MGYTVAGAMRCLFRVRSSEFGIWNLEFGVCAGARSLASYADAGSPLSSEFGVLIKITLVRHSLRPARFESVGVLAVVRA